MIPTLLFASSLLRFAYLWSLSTLTETLLSQFPHKPEHIVGTGLATGTLEGEQQDPKLCSWPRCCARTTRDLCASHQCSSQQPGVSPSHLKPFLLPCISEPGTRLGAGPRGCTDAHPPAPGTRCLGGASGRTSPAVFSLAGSASPFHCLHTAPGRAEGRSRPASQAKHREVKRCSKASQR